MFQEHNDDCVYSIMMCFYR